MAVCDGPWRMTLGNDRTGTPVVVLFRDIRVNGTNFTGVVLDESETRLSDLTGTCEDLATGDPRLARITFQFRLPGNSGPVGIFLAGVGFIPPMSNPLFLGRFRAYTPDRYTPSLNAEATLVVGIDVGDTGTGNGMQAQ